MFHPFHDKPQFFSGVVEFIGGLIFFPLIFLLVQSFLRFSKLGQGISRKYGLSLAAILDIANKITSTSFATLACSAGLYVLIFSQKPWSLEERFFILDNYLIFGVSYFFYDIASMYLVFLAEKESEVSVSWSSVVEFLVCRPLILLHHLLVPLLGFPALMLARGGRGDCLLGAAFLIEASTPFVSARVVLVHLNMKEHRIYFLNGLLMMLSFFFCRVLLFPFIYYQYSCITGTPVISIFSTTPLWVHILVLGLWAPQLIWFRKIIVGSLKILRKSGRSKTNEGEEDKKLLEQVAENEEINNIHPDKKLK